VNRIEKNSKQNQLLDKGILLQSGQINKNKINLISGAVTLPFLENVWVTTNGDTDTIIRMRDILTNLFNDGRETEMLDMLRLLYGVWGLQFLKDIEQLAYHPEAKQYFLFSFLLVFDDAIQDYIADNRTQNETTQI
jgi:hypothetical protein